jgi:hypothetical protein
LGRTFKARIFLGKIKMSDFAYKTEEFKIDGRAFRASFFYDPFMGAPWEENDGHGPVREVRNREEKRAGEIILEFEQNRYWLYNVQGATTLALDSWGLGDEEHAFLAAKLGRAPTKREISARAVEIDVSHLRKFLRGEWHWVIVTVSLLDDDGKESSKHADTCGGFESSDGYPLEWAKEQAAYMVKTIKAEAAEVQYWAERDVVTA